MVPHLLLFLAQLWGCHSVPVGTALAYRQPDCDDPETEQAALAAVDYLNNHVLRGYKHTLNQIDKVRVWPRVSDPAVCRAPLGASKVPSPSTRNPQRCKLSGFFPGAREGARGWGNRQETFWVVVKGLRRVLDRGEETCETRNVFK